MVPVSKGNSIVFLVEASPAHDALSSKHHWTPELCLRKPWRRSRPLLCHRRANTLIFRKNRKTAGSRPDDVKTSSRQPVTCRRSVAGGTFLGHRTSPREGRTSPSRPAATADVPGRSVDCCSRGPVRTATWRFCRTASSSASTKAATQSCRGSTSGHGPMPGSFQLRMADGQRRLGKIDCVIILEYRSSAGNNMFQ